LIGLGHGGLLLLYRFGGFEVLRFFLALFGKKSVDDAFEVGPGGLLGVVLQCFETEDFCGVRKYQGMFLKIFQEAGK